jgi:hypothetical protein
MSYGAKAKEIPCGEPYKIQDDDWLSKIATWAYGDMEEETIQFLLDANPQVLKADKIYAGDKLTIPCKDLEKIDLARATKSFIARAGNAAVSTVAEPEIPFVPASAIANRWTAAINQVVLPEPPVENDVHLGDGPAEGEILTAPEPTAPATASSFLPQTKAGAKAKAKPAKNKNGESFQILFNAAGVNPGSYPAVFLRDQDNKGYWHKRDNIAIRVETVEDKLFCRILLDKKPPLNSAVVIDWGNGQAFYVSGDILVQGATAEVPVPKNLSGKKYTSLKAMLPVKRHPLMAAVRIIGPTAMRSGLAFASIGPQGLILAPASLASDILMHKLRNDRGELARISAPRLEIQYQVAGQQSKINELEKRIASLQSQLGNLRQDLNQVAAPKEGN